MAISKTPRGKAMWAKVVEPDTKFNPAGDYTIDLVLNADDDDVKELCKSIDDLVAAEVDKQVEENPTKFKKMPDGKPLSAAPYREVYDEDDEETGELQFKFKLKAAIQTKKGDTFKQRPLVVDSRGKPVLQLDANKNVINRDFKVGNGSTVVVHFEPFAYYMSSTKTCGVSLRLKAVQIIELVEYGSFDFEEEEGFEIKETTTAAPSGGEEAGSEEDWDF